MIIDVRHVRRNGLRPLSGLHPCFLRSDLRPRYCVCLLRSAFRLRCFACSLKSHCSQSCGTPLKASKTPRRNGWS